MMQLNTFSVVARCERTGMLGVAVSTAVPAVGGICPFVRNGVGAVATQSWVNPYLGIDAIRLLEQGLSAEEALKRLIADDPGRGDRQLGIVDAQGRAAAYTGDNCVPWAGHIIGEGLAVQGNMLVGAPTVEAMAAEAEAGKALDLPERLMRVLEAGQAAGGDKRGKQSAALKVLYREEFPYVDIRADEHPEPVAELRRIFEVVKIQLLPFTEGMPSRSDPIGKVSDEVLAMLSKAPADRRP
jgi:uncharacterized Ntn-hydrolase superfamily protein